MSPPPVTFLTIRDGDMISQSILDVSKKMDDVNKKFEVLDEVINNITQQYHQFAIAFEKSKPLFETLVTDIETVKDLQNSLNYYKSEAHKLDILNNYEINPDLTSQNKIIKKKKSIIRKRK